MRTTITFVNSHLAAFDEMTDRRNADFHDLSRRMVFQYSTEVEGNEGSSTIAYPINVSLFETDVLFWMVRTNIRRCQCFS
jgi:phosphatidylinositol-bisphosphatase